MVNKKIDSLILVIAEILLIPRLKTGMGILLFAWSSFQYLSSGTEGPLSMLIAFASIALFVYIVPAVVIAIALLRKRQIGYVFNFLYGFLALAYIVIQLHSSIQLSRVLPYIVLPVLEMSISLIGILLQKNADRKGQ